MSEQQETPEGRLQADCFQWHWNTYPHLRQTLWHVNNKSRNAIEGNRMRAKGVVKGVSDLMLLCPPDEPAGSPNRRGKTAYIEMKVPGGSQEKEQASFQKQVEEYGCQEYYICWSLAEFQSLVKRLQKLP